jgi:Uri superfamily endonuclease
MKGSYILLMELKEDKIISIGKLGNINFKKGFYAYIGSALNGFDQRINRHLKKDKKNYWHIDYLTGYADIVDVFYKENITKEECNIVKSFSKINAVNGFGCSDCNCKSHLFNGLKNQITSIIDIQDMKKLSKCKHLNHF